MFSILTAQERSEVGGGKEIRQGKKNAVWASGIFSGFGWGGGAETKAPM